MPAEPTEAQAAKAEAESARANEESKRRRTSLALAASVLLFISLGSGGWLYLLRQEADRQTAEADAQRTHAREMQALAEERDAQRQTADLARADAERAEARAEERAYVASLAAAAADLQRNDSRTLKRRLAEAPERLRGWEWEYLWNESDRSLQTTLTLPPATDGYHMDLSGDGTLVAVRLSGGNEEPIRVYDTRTGAQRAEIKTFSSQAPVMTFSPDHQLLAYKHWGTPGVQIFDIATGRGLVPNRGDFLSFFGFYADAQQAVVLHKDGKVMLFKTADWSKVAELPGNVDDPGAAGGRKGTISPDGKLLVIGAFEKRPMLVYDLSTFTLLKEITDSEAAVALKFNDAGDSLTILTPFGDLIEYSTNDWKKTAETQDGQVRGDFAIHQLKDELSLLGEHESLRLSFDSNGAVDLFVPLKYGWVDLKQLTRSGTLRGHGSPGTSIAVDAERGEIVTAHRDGAISRWDLHHPRDQFLGPSTVAFAPDGAAVYSGSICNHGSPVQAFEVNASTGQAQGILGWSPVTPHHGNAAK